MSSSSIIARFELALLEMLMVLAVAAFGVASLI